MDHASPGHIRCHTVVEESDETGTICNDIAWEGSALGHGMQPLSDKVADHGQQRHAECRETRHQHGGP